MQSTNISDANASLSRLVKFVQETDETVIIGRSEIGIKVSPGKLKVPNNLQEELKNHRFCPHHSW